MTRSIIAFSYSLTAHWKKYSSPASLIIGIGSAALGIWSLYSRNKLQQSNAQIKLIQSQYSTAREDRTREVSVSFEELKSQVLRAQQIIQTYATAIQERQQILKEHFKKEIDSIDESLSIVQEYHNAYEWGIKVWNETFKADIEKLQHQVTTQEKIRDIGSSYYLRNLENQLKKIYALISDKIINTLTEVATDPTTKSGDSKLVVLNMLFAGAFEEMEIAFNAFREYIQPLQVSAKYLDKHQNLMEQMSEYLKSLQKVMSQSSPTLATTASSSVEPTRLEFEEEKLESTDEKTPTKSTAKTTTFDDVPLVFHERTPDLYSTPKNPLQQTSRSKNLTSLLRQFNHIISLANSFSPAAGSSPIPLFQIDTPSVPSNSTTTSKLSTSTPFTPEFQSPQANRFFFQTPRNLLTSVKKAKQTLSEKKVVHLKRDDGSNAESSSAENSLKDISLSLLSGLEDLLEDSAESIIELSKETSIEEARIQHLQTLYQSYRDTEAKLTQEDLQATLQSDYSAWGFDPNLGDSLKSSLQETFKSGFPEISLEDRELSSILKEDDIDNPKTWMQAIEKPFVAAIKKIPFFSQESDFSIGWNLANTPIGTLFWDLDRDIKDRLKNFYPTLFPQKPFPYAATASSAILQEKDWLNPQSMEISLLEPWIEDLLSEEEATRFIELWTSFSNEDVSLLSKEEAIQIIREKAKDIDTSKLWWEFQGAALKAKVLESLKQKSTEFNLDANSLTEASVEETLVASTDFKPLPDFWYTDIKQRFLTQLQQVIPTCQSTLLTENPKEASSLYARVLPYFAIAVTTILYGLKAYWPSAKKAFWLK